MRDVMKSTLSVCIFISGSLPNVGIRAGVNILQYIELSVEHFTVNPIETKLSFAKSTVPIVLDEEFKWINPCNSLRSARITEKSGADQLASIDGMLKDFAAISDEIL